MTSGRFRVKRLWLCFLAVCLASIVGPDGVIRLSGFAGCARREADGTT